MCSHFLCGLYSHYNHETDLRAVSEKRERVSFYVIGKWDGPGVDKPI